MAVGVIATFVAKPESVAQVEEALRKVVAPSRIDDGCEDYALHHDQENERCYYMLERWNDADALERHQEQEHFKALIEALEGKLESLDVKVLDNLL
ncbi:MULTISPECIES: putative quinol monooxygenase [Zymobacter]|uniref:Uncharacterized conserved protein n=1 Tax=Zymobacter palmae TaxID=33074 RepID=A0A348HG17_9GAMM|nr:putative quinol monooxygenase [Zymobacter palmae]BBG30569.1 uncharacterized conserved protein [Zymobacter palmae]